MGRRAEGTNRVEQGKGEQAGQKAADMRLPGDRLAAAARDDGAEQQGEGEPDAVDGEMFPAAVEERIGERGPDRGPDPARKLEALGRVARRDEREGREHP